MDALRKTTDPNKQNSVGNAPLHSLVTNHYYKDKKLKADILYSFLTESEEEIKIDQLNGVGYTALHLAVQVLLLGVFTPFLRLEWKKCNIFFP